MMTWLIGSPCPPAGPLGWAPCPIFPGTRDLARQSGVRVLTFRLCHDLIGARLYLIGHWARVTCHVSRALGLEQRGWYPVSPSPHVH